MLERLTSGLDTESGKHRVGEIVENRWFEILIMCLVVCDVVLVMVEAGVDHHVLCIGGKVVPAPASEHHGAASFLGVGSTFRRRLGQPQAALTILPNLEHSVILPNVGHHPHDPHGHHAESHGHHEESHGHHEESHGHHEHPNEVLMCDTRHGHQAHHLTHTCHMLSIAILVFFLLEILLKLWVNPEHFMASFVHKLDLFVVSVSLIIDVVIIPYVESQVEEGKVGEDKKQDIEIVTGLLILSRSWRFVRIFHGFYEEYHTIEEKTAKDKKENEKLRLALQIAGLDPDVELKKLSHEHGEHGHSEHCG